MKTRAIAAAFLATVLTSAGALGSTGTAGAAPQQAPKQTTCSLTSSALTASATVNTELTTRFATLGNTSGQWVGADSTYSVPLRDGSLAWLFSDTLYGTVTDNTLSPTDSFFLNNSVVADTGTTLTTKTHGTRTAPESLLGPDADGSWYWFGAGTVQPNGMVQIVGLHFARFGTGIWDWGWKNNVVATYDPTTWALTSVAPLPSGANIQWGSWIQRSKGSMLVYGVEDLGAVKYMHIAKVTGNKLGELDNWTFWTGSGWSAAEKDSTRVMAGVSNEYSVTPYRDGYLLVTQDTNEMFSTKILGYTSCSPTGPFVNPVVLYQTPETGLWGSYGNPNVWTYNAHEHPELREGNRLLITYNVNSFDSSQLYGDVTIYRPRFITVTLS